MQSICRTSGSFDPGPSICWNSDPFFRTEESKVHGMSFLISYVRPLPSGNSKIQLPEQNYAANMFCFHQQLPLLNSLKIVSWSPCGLLGAACICAVWGAGVCQPCCQGNVLRHCNKARQPRNVPQPRRNPVVQKQRVSLPVAKCFSMRGTHVLG